MCSIYRIMVQFLKWRLRAVGMFRNPSANGYWRIFAKSDSVFKVEVTLFIPSRISSKTTRAEPNKLFDYLEESIRKHPLEQSFCVLCELTGDLPGAEANRDLCKLDISSTMGGPCAVYCRALLAWASLRESYFLPPPCSRTSKRYRT